MKNFYAITLKKISIYIWVAFLCFGSSVYAKSRSFSDYEKAAKQGDAKAQFSLGDCYKEGKGVLKDYKKAIYWYEKAAKQGDSSAQASLGDCYKKGKGVLRDYEKAIYWYEKAAKHDIDMELGLYSYIYDLIDCYYNGFQDYKKAAYWCKKARDMGFDVSEIWEE